MVFISWNYFIIDYSALPATSLKILTRIYTLLALLCYNNAEHTEILEEYLPIFLRHLK